MCGCLVIRVPHDLHRRQRIYTALIQHRDVVIPVKMERQRRLKLLQNVFRTVSVRLHIAPFNASCGEHEAIPHPRAGTLRNGRSGIYVEDVRISTKEIDKNRVSML